MSDFFRFPHTPHLAWLGDGEPRDDKVLSPAQAQELLAGNVVVEEKVDGANLGFSLDDDGRLRAQNRGQYLTQPFAGQFTRLKPWLASHTDAIASSSSGDLILFGEWCAARHSVAYDRLPDWFLLFDVYDRGRHGFWSSARRDALALQIGLNHVPQLASGRLSLAKLRTMLTAQRSHYRDGPMEGLVIRRDSADLCESRTKLVRADFTQAMDEHWRSRSLEWNRISASASAAQAR